MLFLALCKDKPGHSQLRQQTRPAHLVYLEAQKALIKLAGPFLDKDGQTAIGSMLILDCPDEAGARTFLAGDPYAKAGLFDSSELWPWRLVVGGVKD